jgi:hypothetical protein
MYLLFPDCKNVTSPIRAVAVRHQSVTSPSPGSGACRLALYTYLARAYLPGRAVHRGKDFNGIIREFLSVGADKLSERRIHLARFGVLSDRPGAIVSW